MGGSLEGEGELTRLFRVYKSGLRNCPHILTDIAPHHTMYIIKWAPFHLKRMNVPLKLILAFKDIALP